MEDHREYELASIGHSRKAKAGALRLIPEDRDYLHNIVDWACEVGVLDERETKRAKRFIDKPYMNQYHTANAYNKARLLCGNALTAWIREDELETEELACSNDLAYVLQASWMNEVRIENMMTADIPQRMSAGYGPADSGMREYNTFMHLVDEAASSWNWDEVFLEQMRDYQRNGAMFRIATVFGMTLRRAHDMRDDGSLAVYIRGDE